MAAPKGHKGYKPVGAISKKTQEWNNLGELITEKGAGRIGRIMDEGDDETFLRVYLALLEHFKPKLSRSDVNQNNSGKQEIIIRRESNDSYPPIISSSPGTETDSDEPQKV
jgi:hypothetical protein